MQYRIEKRIGGGFAVYQARPMQATVTHGDGNGVNVATIPVREVIKGYDESVFYAYYDHRTQDWYTDINCGAMRWCGHKTTREIRAALRKCGFDKATIDATLKEAKQK